ncbi:unnamed protein product [Pleuronectes platessa]|uniref:Uncharacterized protein n=1 Tax=Pleuronectes platessa TaxID=8262 RepID=A0A9N7U7N1_PLEPL|nr:unnamed protein product [Pleuronectes platessa]
MLRSRVIDVSQRLDQSEVDLSTPPTSPHHLHPLVQGEFGGGEEGSPSPPKDTTWPQLGFKSPHCGLHVSDDTAPPLKLQVERIQTDSPDRQSRQTDSLDRPSRQTDCLDRQTDSPDRQSRQSRPSRQTDSSDRQSRQTVQTV